MLTLKKRKEYFKLLGLGEYNKANILKFEKKYLPAEYCDGQWGEQDDMLILHCVNVKKYTKNFKPEEFRCGCGGKYCTGYPTYMRETELRNLQAIRTKFGRPVNITSGLRCKKYNSTLKGSSTTSKHLTGQAADFYIAGVTDTLARRKTFIAYLKTLQGFNWAYGNGYGSNGSAVSAPNMGNAVHLDCKNVKATTNTTTKVTTSTVGTKACAKAQALVKSGFKYVKYKTNKNYPSGGGNCIRFTALCLSAAGIKVSTKQDGLLNDAWATKLFKTSKSSKANALNTWQKKNGTGWAIVFNGGSKIPASMLKAGDVLLCYSGSTYKHTALKYTGTKIADCTSSRGAAIREYSKLGYPCKLAFRYTK